MNELLTPAEMGEADRLAVARGVPEMELMERAGAAVAAVAGERVPAGSAVCVVAGPGNNGGDGFVVARLLRERGHAVRILLLGNRAALKGSAAIAADRWSGPTERADPAGLAGAGLIVDALFGAGLTRDIDGEAAALIHAINNSKVPVVAVDLPSGIDGATGAVRGVAIRALESVTFFRRKPGHLLLPGRIFCGRVSVHDIGIPDSVLDDVRPQAAVNDPLSWGQTFPVPAAEAHKYARGHCVVVSGALPHSGAARLAARGALRAGAGLVTLATPPDALLVNAAASLAVMARRMDGPEGLASMLDDPRINTLVLGPGGGVGEPMRQMVLATLGRRRAVVLDADALTSFEEAPQILFEAIQSSSCAAILTPHFGEFCRLFKKQLENIDIKDKIEISKETARVSRAIVILKGGDSIVAAPDGRVAIAENAPPWLATAGSGDVLAGIAAGLLAQGMPAFEAACAAVWLHGEAGRAAGPGLISEDLPDALPQVYRALFERLVERLGIIL